MKSLTLSSLLVSSLLIVGCGGGSSSDNTTITNNSTSSSNSNTDTQQETNNTVTSTTQESETTQQPTETTSTYSSKIPHTNQKTCFNANGNEVSCTNSGQDGAYLNNLPSYNSNSNDTVTDHITNLMWQQTSDTNGDGTINVSDKLSQSAAVSYCSNLSLGGYNDWRLPNIKAMYSLIDFSGQDVSGYTGTDTSTLNPFIDTDNFEFGYGDTSANERIIDAQWATTTNYVSTTMGDEETMFGVNLADGRIKGYPLTMRGSDKLYYVQCVRENEAYGTNDFVDNGDRTISDKATNLMWQKDDSQSALNWEGAIDYCEDLTLASQSDWRLPNAKELQGIVDYTKSPDTSNSAAIDMTYFNATEIINENAQSDYGFYWTGTTHENMTSGRASVYVSFGRALGYMNNQWLDVHGAGAQRSDPKDIDTVVDSAYTTVSTQTGGTALVHGPQGDVVRGVNFARCVRSME
ncbi:MAG: DUF1566 domain-containing protein [Epsilonproteobacteria bacterium]|nr:DUF1566 domain-containing protein [Campylobacterota bacterium]